MSEKSISDDKAIKDQINKIINELIDLINDIRNSREINQAVDQSEKLNSSRTATQKQMINQGQALSISQPSETTDINVNATIIQTAQTLAALNSIKADLCRLPLDFCEKEYIANCIIPLMTATELLSRTSFDLSTSVSILTTSPIVPRKKGKLKDTIHTIYSINDECEELYDILKKRFKKLTKNNGCCIFP